MIKIGIMNHELGVKEKLKHKSFAKRYTLVGALSSTTFTR